MNYYLEAIEQMMGIMIEKLEIIKRELINVRDNRHKRS